MLNTTVKNLKRIDSYLFNNTLYNRWCHFRANHPTLVFGFYKSIAIKNIKYYFKNKIDIFYLRSNKEKNLLGKLLDKYGSTKSGHHYYEDMYDLIFSFSRAKINLLLECGIGFSTPRNFQSISHPIIAGAGLRAWRDYFCNAEIIGIDIDPNVLFTEKRISTYECDQTSIQSINNFVNQANLQPNTVDVIIDDGATHFIGKKTLFEQIIHLLSDNGIYIMECIFGTVINEFIEYFKKSTHKFEIKFISISQQEYPVFIILIKKLMVPASFKIKGNILSVK